MIPKSGNRFSDEIMLAKMNLILQEWKRCPAWLRRSKNIIA